MPETAVRVLLVEDDEEDALLIRGMLAESTGVRFTLTRVVTLGSALEALGRPSTDVVLLDLSLPDSRGLETLRRLLEGAGRRPVVVLTGLDDAAVGREAVREGAQDYLIKGQVNGPLITRALTYAVERQRAQVELDESRRFVREIADASPDILYVYDLAERRYAYINAQLFNILGYTLDELNAPGEGAVARLIHPDSQKGVAEHHRRLLAGADGEIFEVEYLARCAGGDWRWLHSRESVFARDDAGRPRSILGAAQDVTARKRSEELLCRYAERMETLRTVQQELETARRIQQGLLPKRAPALPGFDICGVAHPAEATGGDYYDFIRLPDGCIGLVVGDAMGHGLGPALIAADTCAYVRALAHTQTDPSRLLAAVNRLLVEDMGGEGFVALTFAALDPVARRLVYSNAGQASGYVLDAAGGVKAVLESTDTPLGVNWDGAFPTAGTCHLAPGDLICLVTDGLQEATSPDDECFGIERLLAVLRGSRRKGARDILDDLLDALHVHTAHRPLLDDVTAVIVKCDGA